MNEEGAIRLAGLIAGCTPGWNAASLEVLVDEFRSWHDDAAAVTAVNNICHSWTGQNRPALGVIVNEYRRQTQKNRDMEASIEHGSVMPADEGRWTANQAHRRQYGRDIGTPAGADPDRAAQAIMRRGRFVNGRYCVNFQDVMSDFGGDGTLAENSIKALGRRIVREWNGVINFTPDAPEEPADVSHETSDDPHPINPTEGF